MGGHKIIAGLNDAIAGRVARETRYVAIAEWQPMETAPKDGTRILYINRFDEIGHCQWQEWSDEGGDPAWWDHQADDEVCPLWWLPALPPAPVHQTERA